MNSINVRSINVITAICNSVNHAPYLHSVLWYRMRERVSACSLLSLFLFFLLIVMHRHLTHRCSKKVLPTFPECVCECARAFISVVCLDSDRNGFIKFHVYFQREN